MKDSAIKNEVHTVYKVETSLGLYIIPAMIKTQFVPAIMSFDTQLPVPIV